MAIIVSKVFKINICSPWGCLQSQRMVAKVLKIHIQRFSTVGAGTQTLLEALKQVSTKIIHAKQSVYLWNS